MSHIERPPFFAMGGGPNEPVWRLMLPREAAVAAEVDLRKAIEAGGDLETAGIEHKSGSDGQLWVECSLVGERRTWCVQDAVRPAGRWVRVTRTWRLDAGGDAEAALVFAVDVLGQDTPRVLMPGISYGGNPSADPDRLVPRFADELPSRCLYEEHRYPLPLVHLEVPVPGREGGTVPAGVTLQSVASCLGDNSGNGGASDHWWSLGAGLREDGGALLLHSSTCETNGQSEVVYGSQNQLHPFPRELARFKVGTRITKEVYLQAAAAEALEHVDGGESSSAHRTEDTGDSGAIPHVPTCGIGSARRGAEGWTWRRPVAEARRRLLTPSVSRLTPEQTIVAKLNAARSRFVQEGNVAGFLCLSEPNACDAPRCFLWGWTGQSARLAATLLELSGSPFLEGAVTKPTPAEMAHASLLFFASQPVGDAPLPWAKYFLNDSRWEASRPDGRWHSRQVGETLTHLCLCCEAGPEDASWRRPARAMLERAGELLASESCSRDEVFPAFWGPDGEPAQPSLSTGGAACVSALARIGKLFGKPEWVDAASHRLSAYAARVLGPEPRWPCGATLDANCEDKEAGILLLRACLDVHEATGDERLLDWAQRAADWTLTFMYAWDPGLRTGTPMAKRLNCTGWNSVSVQNQHLDVFTPVEELLRLSEATDNDDYARLARVMVRAVTHTIATETDMCGFDEPGRPAIVGEQAEQFFQTNYYQGPLTADAWRGGHNWWNPLWIVMQPMRDALCLLRHEKEHGEIRV